jgi:hypothetical protein
VVVYLSDECVSVYVSWRILSCRQGDEIPCIFVVEVNAVIFICLLPLFRGFVKYKRAKNQYRPVEDRLQDWDEIFNHKGVMKGIQVQAARYI